MNEFNKIGFPLETYSKKPCKNINLQGINVKEFLLKYWVKSTTLNQ